MNEPTIDRDWLYWKLIRWTQLRSLITMASVFPGMGIGALLAAIFRLPPNYASGPALIGFFAFPLFISWLITEFVCKKKVRCPNCEGSLWECGTGNFKPRRLRIRDDVTACPHCGIPIR